LSGLPIAFPTLHPDLSRRRLQPELMDAPDLDPVRHINALRALQTVNLLSGTTGRIWREAVALAGKRSEPLRVLDLACGGGDVAVALQRRADRAGLGMVVHGCDRSSVALEHARSTAEAKGVDIDFFELDVLAGPLPEGYDLICCSLFLHHLSPDDAVGLLRALAAAARAVLIQDLRRTRVGYALALFTLHALARSDVARVDGLRSVAGAFTMDEAAELARRAGIAHPRLRACWPERFSLSWRSS
jgi:2-polyprenyl-3-methyl-5-hydroxy-6-metoxy-1,4-benzoquinol methylase